MQLEQTIQIISIITFVISTIAFFIKLGQYKTVIDTKIATLNEDTLENKQEIKNLKQEFNELKTNNAQTTSRLEALLIEVKTKLEVLMQLSGLFNKDEKSTK